MSTLRKVSLGVSLAAFGAAQAADRPAVRLRPAQPMDPIEVMARAAPNNGYEFPNPAPRGGDPAIRKLFDTARDEPRSGPTPWQKFSKWMDERAKAVRQAVSGPPMPQPEPRVGQPVRKLFDPKPVASEPGPVKTAPPAYRWYGWGTATPGANQFAPGGDYPQASAQWYAQTGATPGAFPVPTVNPYRPAPSVAPPTYIAPLVPAPTSVPAPAPVIPPPTPAMPQPAARPIPRPTIAETPAVSPHIPQVAPAMPPAFQPLNQVPVPPSSGKATPREPEWKPASTPEAPPLIVPVIRGAEPEFDDSPLARQIQEACRGLVVNVTIRETGPRQLKITFAATTATLAEIAARAISDLGELRPYAVEFEAKVIQ